jgi:CheY-like chemotaxis protein
VTIYLPRTELAEAPGPGALLPVSPAGRARILIVDDDDDVRHAAAEMVEEAGYELATARDGVAALDALERGQFELIITDIVMPGMSGVELARRIRERHPHMPVIFASGYADLQRFDGELADERILKKPYRIAEVAAEIHAVLNGAGSDAEPCPTGTA